MKARLPLLFLSRQCSVTLFEILLILPFSIYLIDSAAPFITDGQNIDLQSGMIVFPGLPFITLWIVVLVPLKIWHRYPFWREVMAMLGLLGIALLAITLTIAPLAPAYRIMLATASLGQITSYYLLQFSVFTFCCVALAKMGLYFERFPSNKTSRPKPQTRQHPYNEADPDLPIGFQRTSARTLAADDKAALVPSYHMRAESSSLGQTINIILMTPATFCYVFLAALSIPFTFYISIFCMPALLFLWHSVLGGPAYWAERPGSSTFGFIFTIPALAFHLFFSFPTLSFRLKSCQWMASC